MITTPEVNQIVQLLAGRQVTFPKIKKNEVSGTYDSKHPDYKVLVQYSSKHAWVDLIFEQRPGVWFRLGDFPDTLQFKAAQEFFNTRHGSARSDIGLETVPEVAEFLQSILK